MKNIKETEIGSLVQDNLNFNRGTEFGERLMDNSLRKFGLGRSVLVDKNNRIIAGNKTVEKAVELGFEKAIVVETSGEQLVVVKRKDIDLDSEMGREMALADNATSAANLEWDAETIQQAQAEFGLDIDSWGVNISETDDEEQEQEKAAEEDDYELNDDVKTSIKEGDMFEFRKGDICHRLICGDSTKQETLTKLMGERKADLWLTEPPYNVNYQGGTKDKLKIANDNMDNAAFVAFLIDAFKTAVNSVKLGGVFYIWHADSMGWEFRYAVRDAGLTLRETLIWVKNSLVLGRQDYQWRHEPCLYGWKDGAAHYFINDRTQTTVFEDQKDYTKMKKDELLREIKRLTDVSTPNTIIYEDKPNRNDIHPTMKPVKLFGRLIANSSRKGETVLDTFLGSGTSMVASHQMGRNCYGVELDPMYCQNIIDRMRKLDPDIAITQIS